VSNKLKSIENIIEISVENFKNKIFLKREEKFEDYLDYEIKKNLNYNFIPKTDFKKSPASDFKLKDIKSGSPVLWLKSQKRREKKQEKQDKHTMKLFEMKDQDVQFKFSKDRDSNYKSTQTSPVPVLNLNPIYESENLNLTKLDDDCATKTNIQENILINDLQSDPCCTLNLDESGIFEDEESPDVHGKLFKWKYGDKLAEGPTSSVYKAFNLQNGSIFVVKRFHSINDEKMALSYQVKIKNISK
jgi:hypothetical protein